MKNQTESPSSINQFFSIQRLAYSLIIMTILIYFIVVARTILIPITFAVFFSFMFAPICGFFQKYIKSDILSILLSFLVVIIPLFAIVMLLSFQVADVFNDLNSIGDKLKEGSKAIMDWAHAQARRTGMLDKNWISENSTGIIDEGIGFIRSSLSSLPQLFISFFITFLYTFFLLYYRRGLKNFFIAQFDPESQDEVHAAFTKIKKLAQKYLYGLGLVIIIMGTLNSIGLFFIGVKYPILWGFLAALLTIIPYIGTALGGLLPFLYAAATMDSIWPPFAVLVYYAIVQAVEGNIITPKIIGNSVSINAMTAILSIIIGGFIWGIAGIILALLLAATVRIIFDQIDHLKPLALLMSNDLYQKENKFKYVYNKERFRLSSIFKIDSFTFKRRK